MVNNTANGMAAADPSDAEIQYAMADILKEGELSKLTSRKVRTQLEERFGISLYERKKEIDRMLMEMIQNQEKSQEVEKEQENGTGEINGEVEDENEDDDDKQSFENDEPLPKKIKKDKEQESNENGSDSDDGTNDMNDEELARQLHENEKGLRTRRGKATKKPVEKKKSKKAKKPKDSSGEKKGFGKLMVLSPELAALVGEEKLSRSDVVKRMWEVIRERKLEDPKNKRYTICDEQLQSIFGRKRIQTFGMMKYLKKHIKDPALII